MKIAIGGLKQETNCFSSVPSPRKDWTILIGEDVLKKRGTKRDLGGMIAAADQYGWELLPTFFAQTRPSAPTDAENYAWMKQQIVEPIRAHKDEIDGVMLCLHGAMLAEGTPDPEGDVVSEVRSIIGNKPLMITLDLHANNSETTAKSVDAVFGCDTNPHIDFYERGLECAACMKKTLEGEWRPVTAHRHPPVVFPTINMLTDKGPMYELMERAREWEKQPGIINVSVCGGFPFGDADYTGPSVVATADGDRALAQKAADDVARLAWELRERFFKKLPTIVEAVAEAKEALAADPGYPVILADVADNSGGGSSDTTMLMRALIEADFPDTAIAAVWDPETVQKALEVGIGGTGKFAVGGKFHDYGEPVEIEATVRAITDGECRCYGPMTRGDACHFGIGARLQVGNVHICVYSNRCASNAREIFLNLGLDPARMKVLQIKSRGHFRADFEPIASRIIEVDAPGAANPNILRYPYKNLKAWPIDRTVTEWKI